MGSGYGRITSISAEYHLLALGRGSLLQLHSIYEFVDDPNSQ